MKKILFLVVLGLIACQAGAQEFHLIPKVGLNLAHATNHDAFKTRAGLNIGAAADYMLNSRLGLESGLFFSMQGTKVKAGEEYTSRLSYLNIPVYAKMYLWRGLHAFAGPQFGFNVSEKAKGVVDGKNVVESTDLIRTFDFSIGLGAGYEFGCGAIVAANYNIGANNLWRSGIDSFKSRNSVFQITLGYRLKLGK